MAFSVPKQKMPKRLPLEAREERTRQISEQLLLKAEQMSSPQQQKLLRKLAAVQAPLTARQNRQILEPREPRPRSSDGRTDHQASLKSLREQNIAVDRKLQHKADPSSEWALVQALDKLEYLQKEEEQKRALLQKKQNHIDQLSYQRQQRLMEQDKTKQAWKEWRAELEEDAAKHRSEEEAKRQKAFEQRKLYDQDRKQQLQEFQSRVKDQRQADLLEGQRMAQAAIEAAKQAADLEELKRRRERSAAQNLIEDLKKERVLKDEIKRREAQWEHKMNLDSQALMEKQERDRLQFFINMREKQSSLQKQYESGVGNDLERRAQEDEERATKHREDLAQKARLQEVAKAKRLQEHKQKTFDAVQQQLEEHERNQKFQREEERRFVEVLQREQLAAEAQEKAKLEAKKAAREDHAVYLRKQIAERSVEPVKLQRDRMNDVERALNQDRLKRALELNLALR